MKIKLNKNRGWRGLAQLECLEEGLESKKIMFSFSGNTWQDLMAGHIVYQDNDKYIILDIDNTDALPQHSQRSVLLKDFKANVIDKREYDMNRWMTSTINTAHDWSYISHFTHNSNAYTTSVWNDVGIRVNPIADFE